MFFFFSSRRRHTRCSLVTGVQTCALPISARLLLRAVRPRPVHLQAVRVALQVLAIPALLHPRQPAAQLPPLPVPVPAAAVAPPAAVRQAVRLRSEEHTSELQSLMRNSYAVFCLKKKQQKTRTNKNAK